MTALYTQTQLDTLLAPLPGYTTWLDVMRWIPPKLHASIREGRCLEDLTPYFQTAHDWILGQYGFGPVQNIVKQQTAGYTFAPALYAPPGTYLLRGFMWSGRVHLLGAGPTATRFVYAPPVDPAAFPAEEAIIVPDYRIGWFGPDLSHAGIEGIGLHGFAGGPWLTSRSVPRMARHLLVWTSGVDIRFRLDNVRLSSCRGDAVVVTSGFTNLTIDRLWVDGVGGYGLAIAGAMDPAFASAYRHPAAQPPASPALVQSAASKALLRPGSGPAPFPTAVPKGATGSMNEDPCVLTRVRWTNGLAPWVTANVSDGPADLATRPWGAGLLRMYNTAGAWVRLSDAHVRLTRPVLDGGGVIVVDQVNEDQGGREMIVEADHVVGSATGSAHAPLVRCRSLTAWTKDDYGGLPRRNARVLFLARGLHVDGMPAHYVNDEPRQDAYFRISDEMVVDGRSGLVATDLPEGRGGGLCLGGLRLEEWLKEPGVLVNSLLGVRYRHGDLLMSKSMLTSANFGWDADYPGVSIVAATTPLAPTCKALNAATVLEPADEKGLASGPNDGYWQIHVYTQPSVIAAKFMAHPSGQVAGLGIDVRSPKSPGVPGTIGSRTFIDFVAGDNVCITRDTASDNHFHRTILSADMTSGVVLFDTPLPISAQEALQSKLAVTLRPPRRDAVWKLDLST